jgi:hypothetical protein
VNRHDGGWRKARRFLRKEGKKMRKQDREKCFNMKHNTKPLTIKILFFD